MPYTTRRINLAPSYTASDVLLVANDDQSMVLEDVYTKHKESTIIQDVFPYANLRLYMELYDIGANTITATWYRNGTILPGATICVSASDGSWTGFTQDFTFTDLMYGDKLQVYAYRTTGTGGLGRLRNFRVSGTENPFFNTMV
jgi:hypothetical protein